MARTPDENSRVVGPTWIESRRRWRLIVITPTASRPEDRRTVSHHRTEVEANEVKENVEQRLFNVTLQKAIDGYEKHLIDKETIGYSETIRRLRAFFPDLSMMIGRVTPERGKKWYDVFRERKRPDGEPISVSYHRATLINARSMFTWCIEQGWISDNPLEKVKGIGKRKRGKRLPSANEFRLWFRYTWARVKDGDRTALGCMMALSMSLRSSDLTRRVVRDVDFDGTQLIVENGKSEKSNEPRVIPKKLQPFVLKMIEGRDLSEPLFPRACKGKRLHMSRRWLEQGMERFCEAAGVRYFCPHALKSVSGGILAKRGAAANVIMDHLSHEESETTFRHYVDRSVVDQAEAERVFDLFDTEGAPDASDDPPLTH